MKVVGYDEFIYAVEMTKFMLSAFKHDCQNFELPMFKSSAAIY